MIVGRSRRFFVRIECAPARANRRVSQIAEDEQHRHDAPAASGAFQRDHSARRVLRRAARGKSGALVNSTLLVRAALEIPQAARCRSPSHPFAGPLVVRD